MTIALLGFVWASSLSKKHGKLPPASTPEGKKALIMAVLSTITGSAVVVLNDATKGSRVDRGRLIFNSAAITILFVVIPILSRWGAISKKINQKSVLTVLKLWAAGFILYTTVSVYIFTGYDKKHGPMLEALIVGVAFLDSVAVIILSTAIIFIGLRPEIADTNLTKKQRLVGTYALMSLLGIVAGIFIPLFNFIAMTNGFMAIKQSNDEENRILKNLKSYRLIGILVIAVAAVRIIIFVVMARWLGHKR